MGKVGYKLPEKYKEKAIENEISLQTVYGRLSHGWNLEEAVTVKPAKRTKKKRLPTGEIATDRKKYPVSIHFYEDKQELLDEAIAKSGKTRSEFIADVLDEWLKKWAKKERN